MARTLASIVEISEVRPIEGADRLELALMKGKGWKVVVQKGEFKVGDIAIYFEIDSFLDPNDERYTFLRDRCLRKFVSKGGGVLREGIKIKTIKLRGEYSQGLLMPISKFPEITSRIKGLEVGLPDDNGEQSVVVQPLIGADVTKLLHVEHYDEVKEQLQPAMGNPIAADVMGDFPSALGPKSDEERIQNLGEWFETMKGRKWEITVKADGTSCTIAYAPSIDPENPCIVCSRNKRLKRENNKGVIPVYWKMAEKYHILDILKEAYDKDGTEYMLQAEVVGPGIQADRNKEKEHTLLCFRIWFVKEQKWMNPKTVIDFCNLHRIPHVEVLEPEFLFFDKITTMEEALKFAEGKTAAGNEREGIVCKTVDDGPYSSFKVVSNRYLLKQED